MFYNIFSEGSRHALRVGYEGYFVVAHFASEEDAEYFIKNYLLDPCLEYHKIIEDESTKDHIAKEGDPVLFTIIVINRDRSTYTVDFKDIYYGIYMGESIEPLESQTYRTSQTVSFQYGKEKDLLS